MRTTISIISIGLALATFQASVADAAEKADAPKVIKKDDLPALKGGKTRKNSDGIPGCSAGRAVFGPHEQDREPLLSWAGSHQNHVCFGADTLYVCRVGRNLSVRCK
jgi:hypothetical protein